MTDTRPVQPRTLYDKLWDAHLVRPATDRTPAMLYIDLHLIHEVTSPQAFAVLRDRGIGLRRPDLTLATVDHCTPTAPAAFVGGRMQLEGDARTQVSVLEKNCADFGVLLHGIDSRQRGIVHVIGPELGATQPGRTIVCGDSHTSTHGAFGALAFGIGTTEVGHVLATQCLLQRKAKNLGINVSGKLAAGVTAKDLVLHIIREIGVGGGTGHVMEFRGEAIRALDMEARMTLCNMAIEAGARSGLVAPDDVTFEYLRGRPLAPPAEQWSAQVAAWRALASDPGASFDHEVQIDAGEIRPMVTYGTNPGMAMPIDSAIPAAAGDPAKQRALEYMDLTAGEPLRGHPVDIVFVGSCTNSRISDLRAVAAVLDKRKVADSVRMLIVPGSQDVKRQAEAEGLHEVFAAAGAEWHESGCSMCLAMNGDRVEPGRYALSTSNRNFEGRQGPGARTLLASPLTAAASAIAGRISDPRDLLETDSNSGNH